ncbi:hypothetical protein AKJ61_04285 [candidate division MSBL1 archaeon SCGC-AAA259B11]|uniref:Uncharacterized protein n=1 Tax=candidate division MSBL1 archaeon SCGC-AAA259B11 TaxID=1698260 RepID=A0A133U3J3_9EURY|nr:hypothetical protein AKJ61_04285 [candidate division MSBL1 archaeon SCGC-AAA259B11]
MAGHRPFSVIITRFIEENASTHRKGIKELSKTRQRRRGDSLPIMIINISGYSLSAKSEEERIAGRLLRKKDLTDASSLRKHTWWVDWNPSSETFSQAILREVAKH